VALAQYLPVALHTFPALLLFIAHQQYFPSCALMAHLPLFTLHTSPLPFRYTLPRTAHQHHFLNAQIARSHLQAPYTHFYCWPEPYIYTVYLMISLPIILYIHRIYSWFWPTLHISPPICYMQYMDRTFVSQQQRTPVFALGLELWRNHVVRSKQIAPRLQVQYLCDFILRGVVCVIAFYLELWRNLVMRSKQIAPRLQV